MKFILLTIAILVTGTCFAQGVPPEQKFPKTPLVFPNNYKIPKGHLVFPNNPRLPKLPLDLPNNVVGLKKIIISNDLAALSLPQSGLAPQAKYLGILPNGNTVFALPQDNMPCIVPNENATVAMPNVSALPTLPYSFKGPGAIPNPAVPLLLPHLPIKPIKSNKAK